MNEIMKAVTAREGGYIPISFVALFTIAKIRNQARCVSTS